VDNYFIWNDINSLSQDIYCSNPKITIPKRDYEKVVIPGRSGFYAVDNGSYSTVVKSLECRLRDNTRIESIALWLNGSGKVIFSDEAQFYYKGVINQALPIERLLERYRAFMLTFDCQPFKYKVSEQNDKLTITKSPFNFLGQGTFWAAPVITIYGSGNINITVNGELIQLTDVNGHITINSEVMDCYKDGVNANMQMVGEFPKLRENGQLNAISYTGNVSKIEVIPSWRWL